MFRSEDSDEDDLWLVEYIGGPLDGLVAGWPMSFTGMVLLCPYGDGKSLAMYHHREDANVYFTGHIEHISAPTL